MASYSSYKSRKCIFYVYRWSAKKYGPQFVFSRRVVMEVDKLLQPDETLYVWGQNPEFYFWSKRRPPTGVFWSTDLMNNPLAQEHTIRALEDLEREKPEIFVLNDGQFRPPPNHPLIAWATKRYILLPGNPNRTTLLDLLQVQKKLGFLRTLAGEGCKF